MIVTNNQKLADKCRLLRQYGWRKQYISQIPGLNSRLDELQAAVLRIKLKYLDQDNNKRRKITVMYNKELNNIGDLILPQERDSSTHVYHLYVIRTKYRDKLKKYLEKHKIYPLIHYPLPIHLQPAYKGRIKQSGKLANTQQISQEILSLPIYPELTIIDQQKIITVIKRFYK